MYLEEILEQKKKEVQFLKDSGRFGAPPSALVNKGNRFTQALRAKDGIRLIAEIKRRSPSRGAIRADLDVGRQARAYERAGAAAISVLTDEQFFGGSINDLNQARMATSLPLLRKDFMIDEVQIWQSAAKPGADAILLIVAVLSAARLKALLQEAARCSLACLVETHTEEEVKIALDCGAEIIGINNRDLKTFEVDLAITEKLCGLIPKEKIIVSESGIRKRREIEWLQGLGVNAVLVGETLLKHPDPAAKIRELLGDDASKNLRPN